MNDDQCEEGNGLDDMMKQYCGLSLFARRGYVKMICVVDVSFGSELISRMKP
jgi:hypothetical protein